MPLVLAIHITDRNGIRLAVIDSTGTRKPVEDAFATPGLYFEAIDQLRQRAEALCHGRDVIAVGISITGSVKGGRITAFPRAGWVGQCLSTHLEAYFGRVPIALLDAKQARDLANSLPLHDSKVPRALGLIVQGTAHAALRAQER